MKRWLGFDSDQNVVRTFKILPLFKTMRCCCLFLVWVRKSREKRTKSCNFEDWCMHPETEHFSEKRFKQEQCPTGVTSNYQKSLWLYPFEVPLSATASSASHLFIISYAWPNSSIAWHAKLAAVLENCTRSKRLWKWRLLRKKVRADVRILLLCILYRDILLHFEPKHQRRSFDWSFDDFVHRHPRHLCSKV